MCAGKGTDLDEANRTQGSGRAKPGYLTRLILSDEQQPFIWQQFRAKRCLESRRGRRLMLSLHPQRNFDEIPNTLRSNQTVVTFLQFEII